MSILTDSARSAVFLDGQIVIAMESGAEIRFPVAENPRLAHGTAEQLSRIELSPFGIHWPDLDEDLSVAGLLRGSPTAQAARVQEPPPTYKTQRRSRSRSSRRR